MTLKQIAALGRKLTLFLALFADCFGRRDARALLRVYVKGQLSNLPRKTAEAIALEFGTAPRTLQRFLESIKWDEEKLRDRCQQIVAKDHAHPEAIGCVDESGTTKSGTETVGVGRQYNGNRGKVDNCVVGVHISYSAPGFQALLDSTVYLPEDYANDPVRRKKTTYPRKSSSKPSRRSRWTRSIALCPTACAYRLGRSTSYTVATGSSSMAYSRVSKCLLARYPSTFMVGCNGPRCCEMPRKTRENPAPEEISTPGSSPTVERSPQPADLFAGVSRAVMATVSHQGHRQRSRGLGSKVGRVLAQGREWFTNTAALFDRRSQRVDWRSEILLVQSRAEGTESAHGPVHHAAVAAAGRLRALVNRKLLSRGEGRTRPGSLRAPRLALPASALLRDAAQSSVLCPPAPRVQRRSGRSSGSDQRGTSPQRDERLVERSRLAFCSPSRTF